jgi:hypothetical protein
MLRAAAGMTRFPAAVGRSGHLTATATDPTELWPGWDDDPHPDMIAAQIVAAAAARHCLFIV